MSAPAPLGALIRRHGVPVPLASLWAANTVSRSQFERMSADARLEELRRRADMARRIREDAEAAEWAAGRWDDGR